jgi:hypothetical protein
MPFEIETQEQGWRKNKVDKRSLITSNKIERLWKNEVDAINQIKIEGLLIKIVEDKSNKVIGEI